LEKGNERANRHENAAGHGAWPGSRRRETTRAVWVLRPLLGHLRLLVAAGMAVSGAGCGEGPGTASSGNASGEAVLTASTLGEQVVLSVDEYRALPQFAEADGEYGDRLSLQCRACHTFEQGGPHMIGPNLHGFFGRPAGSAPGFAYSDALGDANFVWTPRAMDAWLASPGRFLPGNSMAYGGLGNAADRNALIASLLRQTTVGAAGE
jgi:cytochrome c